MALAKTISTPYGDATYHLISEVHVVRNKPEGNCVRVESYRDEAHRHQEGAAPYLSEIYPLQADPLSSNLVEQGYVALVASPAWEDATQV